jgi:hypothetical protein
MKVLAGAVLVALLFPSGYVIGKHAADRWYAQNPIVYREMLSGVLTRIPRTACVIEGQIRFDVDCANPLPVK